jgi:ureidoglycolate lyase
MALDLDTIVYPPTTGVRRLHTAPLVVASEASLAGLGQLVLEPREHPIEIVRWPAHSWRPVDAGSGDQGGVTEGPFTFAWRGETLYARNEAVGDSYLFGWSTWPEEASAAGPTTDRTQALIWRANYHPDGGQLVYPTGGGSFVVPLAPPGDDVTPGAFTAFWFDGSAGLYVHPNVWHGAFVPHADEAVFFDRQSRVHARVSVDFPREFGCYLSVPLARP